MLSNAAVKARYRPVGDQAIPSGLVTAASVSGARAKEGDSKVSLAATLPQTLDSGDQVLILARYAVSAVALGQTVDRIVVGADAAEQEVAVQAACGGQEYDLASGVRRILARDGETILRTLQVASEEDGQLVTEAVA